MDRLIAANSVPQAQADTAPTTGTPQFATDGNPASNLMATRWPSYQYNAIQEELIAILTAANITPDRTNNAQIAAAIRALITQSAAVIGDRRALVSSVAAASSTKTVTADEIVVGSALGGQKYVLANFSGTGNLATTGVNGMDTGLPPTNGFVAEYAIFNPTTGAKGLLYQNATSAAAPNVYGGANMPAGYTASALVTVWPTNGSAQFVGGFQRDRGIFITSTAAITTSSNAPSQTQLSIAGVVPMNARSISGVLHEASTATGSCVVTITPGLGSAGGQNLAGALTASQVSECNYSMALLTPQSIYYTANVSAGTPTFIIYISGYTI